MNREAYAMVNVASNPSVLPWMVPPPNYTQQRPSPKRPPPPPRFPHHGPVPVGAVHIGGAAG